MQEKAGLSPIVSAECLGRLPPIFREIIEHQREIDRLVAEPVVELRVAQNAMDRRAFLARHADRIWRTDQANG